MCKESRAGGKKNDCSPQLNPDTFSKRPILGRIRSFCHPNDPFKLVSDRFSLIIPAYNEARYLPRLISSVRAAELAFPNTNVEIIVADNSSTDDTAGIAASGGCKVVRVDKRCIAAARNGGAGIASGEIFCFIDADSEIHPETFVRIDEAMQDPSIIAGSTGIYLERMSPGLMIPYHAMMLISWVTTIDAGVVFCRREDFFAVGGYYEDLLLAEDVDFLFALKRHGREHRQKLTRLKGVEALGCTRKFDEHGDWHYFKLLWQVLPNIIELGIGTTTYKNPPSEITDYWYQPNR